MSANDSMRADVPERPEASRGDQPLTKREEEMLTRLFSDPTKYPMTLKTWLVAWLEQSDLTIPLGSVNGLAARLALIEDRLEALEP